MRLNSDCISFWNFMKLVYMSRERPRSIPDSQKSRVGLFWNARRIRTSGST